MIGNGPVSGPVQQALDLLASDLKEVVFPGLEPQVLEAAHRQVLDAAEKVARMEQAFEDARRELTEAQDALLAKVQRAVAYARIYAEDDPELSERIDAVALPKPLRRAPRSEASPSPEPAPARRRGRPRSIPSEASAELPGCAASAIDA